MGNCRPRRTDRQAPDPRRARHPGQRDRSGRTDEALGLLGAMAKRRAGPQAIGRYNKDVNPTSPPAVVAASRAAATGKILAVDYGRTRIGLAIAESANGIARPFGTLERVNRNEDMRRL